MSTTRLTARAAAATVAAAVVLLTACAGGSTTDTESSGPALPSPSEQATTEATPTGAESSGPALPSASEEGTTEATSEDAPEPGPEISPRGNRVAALGEEVPLAAEGDTVTATVTIDEVTVDAPCTGDYPAQDGPENGHFVRLDLRAATVPTDYPGAVSDVSFNNSYMRFIGPDGVTFNGPLGTFAAFSCLAESEQLPSTLGPGQQFAGSIMIDVPATSGTIIYENTTGGSGIEWGF